MPLLAKRYSYLSVIGEGASAQVILAEDTLRPGNHLVAIKIMKRQYSYAGQKEARTLRYIQATTPEVTRVVRLLGTFMHAGHVCLVLERLFASLLDYLSLSATLAPYTRLSNLRSIAYQLLGTVAVLHSRGVVNSDLKPDNVLLRQPQDASTGACPEVVITDFGSAFSQTETDTSRLVFEMQTLPYRAPEVALGQGSPLGTALDMWSLGCILAELALQQPLFPCHSPAQLIQQMEQLLGPLPVQLQRSCPRPGGSSSSVPPFSPVTAPGSSRAPPSGQVIPVQPVACAGRSAISVTATAAPNGGASLVPAALPVQAWQELLSPLGQELAKVDRNLADVVMGMLQYDPAQRLTAAAALLHPFFDAISPVRALMQATSQPGQSWSSYEDSPKLQAQPVSALAENVEERPAGQSYATAQECPQIVLDRHQGNAAQHAHNLGPASGARKPISETARRALSLNQAEQSKQPGGVLPRMEPQRGAPPEALGMGTPRQTGAAPGQAVARLGSLGATGRPAANPGATPAQLLFGAAADAGAAPEGTSISNIVAGQVKGAPQAAAAESRMDAAEACLESRPQKHAGRLQRAPAAAAAVAEDAVEGHKEGCSSGSYDRRKGALGARERVFAALESQLPSSLSGPAGYTDTFAFPAADVAAADAGAVPQDIDICHGIAVEVRGGPHAAVASAPVGGDQTEEVAGGNVSESSPSSPGTPGSSGGAAREGFKPPAVAAAAEPSRSEHSGSAGNQPAARSSTSGVRSPKRTSAAGQSGLAQPSRKAPTMLNAVLTTGPGPEAPIGAGSVRGSGGSATAAANTGIVTGPEVVTGAARVLRSKGRAPEAAAAGDGDAASAAQSKGGASRALFGDIDAAREDLPGPTVLQDERAQQRHSGHVRKQDSSAKQAPALVNPALERAQAASTSAASRSSLARKPAAKLAASGPEMEASPPQTTTSGPCRNASKQAGAAQGGKSGTTEAPAMKPGTDGFPAERGEAAKKKRHRVLGPDGSSGSKRSRARREPDHAAVDTARGRSVPASEVLSAEQKAAVTTDNNGGAKLDLLAAAAHQVYSWPRRRSSLEGAPGRAVTAAAKEPRPTSPGAEKRPRSPLIRWPAAAAAMPDKRGSALSRPPRSMEIADWDTPLGAGVAGKQPERAAQPHANGPLEPAAAMTPARSSPKHGKSLRDRSASARKSSKPWWVV
ncbi:g10793 [Coccomyxa elongata]